MSENPLADPQLLVALIPLTWLFACEMEWVKKAWPEYKRSRWLTRTLYRTGDLRNARDNQARTRKAFAALTLSVGMVTLCLLSAWLVAATAFDVI